VAQISVHDGGANLQHQMTDGTVLSDAEEIMKRLPRGLPRPHPDCHAIGLELDVIKEAQQSRSARKRSYRNRYAGYVRLFSGVQVKLDARRWTTAPLEPDGWTRM
jgi:hypothetical protein